MGLSPFTADLTKDELRALVNDLAERSELWSDEVAFSDAQRHYVSLHRDDHVDIWLLCWTRNSDTGWHDHDVSSGAVCVVQGAINEHNPRIGGQHAQGTVPAGQSFHFGPEHIHRLTGDTDDTVTIHAYSPPLWRLGQYAIDDDGVMTRISVSYADELRPVENISSEPDHSAAVRPAAERAATLVNLGDPRDVEGASPADKAAA